MFGLLSDLDKTKWQDSKEEPPSDKKKMAGGTYDVWGIVKVASEPDHLKYFLNSNSGAPNQGLLYYSERNPLKNVGHCWMTFLGREQGNVITGIAIEDDWVIMKPEVIEEMKQKYGPPIPKEELERAVLMRSETIDMGIYGDLTHNKWDKKDKPKRGQRPSDYHFCEVLHSTEAGPNAFLISLGDDKGNSIKATITEAQRNPFHAITKGHFKIVDGIIKGVIVEEDWVEMYQ